jgi:hypothetical protein
VETMARGEKKTKKEREEKSEWFPRSSTAANKAVPGQWHGPADLLISIHPRLSIAWQQEHMVRDFREH